MNNPDLWSYAARSQLDPNGFGTPLLAGKVSIVFHILDGGVFKRATMAPFLVSDIFLHFYADIPVTMFFF